MEYLPNQNMRPMDELRDEPDLIRAFKLFIEQAREASQAEVNEIERNWKYYWGQHYLRKMGDRWVSDTGGGRNLRIQRDIIQVAIDALRPILVKMRPITLALATYPEADAMLELSGGRGFRIDGLKNSDVCGFITDCLKKVHRGRHEDTLLAELMLEVMVAGQAYRMLLPVKRQRMGWVLEPKLYPRSRVYLDPKGTRLNDFADFKGFAVEDEMDASEIEQFYGISEREYTQDVDIESRMLDYDSTGLFRGATEFRRFGSRVREHEVLERRAYKIHTGYFNDRGADLVSYSDKPASLNYPYGRQLIMINYQKIVIDQRNPFWHGDYPITCFQSLPIPFVARGLSEIGKLKDVQKGVNLLLSALIGTTMLGQNPKLFYEEGAFNPNDWQAGPGGMVRFSRGAISSKQVDWFQPQGADRGAFNLLKDMEFYGTENVAGVTESLRGETPPAGTSGVLYNSEQSAAMTGPTFKIQQMDAGHHRFARQEIECMQQFVDFRDPYYSDLLDMSQYHPLMADAVKDVYYRVEYESQSELPHNPIARHNFYWNQYIEGIIPFDEYIDRSGVSLSPQAREKARQSSMQNYMPGVPREVRLQLMMQMAANVSAVQGAQQQLGVAGQQAIGGQTAEPNANEGGIAGPEGQGGL